MANPVPIPYQTPIAKAPKEGGEIKRGRGGRSLGGPERPTNDPYSYMCTQPWIKWFQFLNDLATTSPVFQDASSTDAWKNDFSQEDFWSNVPGPGASPPASWDIINAETNHPGIQRLLTDVNNGDITSAFFPVAAAAGSVRWDQISTVTMNFRTGATITNYRIEGGISSDARSNWPAAAFEFGNDMVYFFFDTAVDANLHLRVRAAGVTTHDLTVLTPLTASTWMKCIFQRRQLGTGVVLDLLFSINDEPATLVTTLSTGLPADNTAFGGMFKAGTRTGAARVLDIDRFLMPIPNSPPLAR